MLLNAYLKLLGEVIPRFGVGSYQYADDTQLFLSLFQGNSQGPELLFGGSWELNVGKEAEIKS